MCRKRSLQYRDEERGYVFLGAVVTLTVLLILGASLIEHAQNAVYRTALDHRSNRTFHLAEAGIHQALWALNEPNGWLTYAGDGQTALGAGYFEVAVSPAPSARGVFTERLTLLAKGYLPGPNGTKRSLSRIRVIVHKDPRYFAYAVFGSNKVRIGNGIVTASADSYTSDQGNYGGSNVAARADIGTNSIVSGAVEILPLGQVHGNVTVGAGASDPLAVVNNKGTITGTITSAEAPTLLPSITSIPPGAINLGDVWLEADQQLVLNEGTYYMTDLDMFGNSSIVCNGKVVIYMDESTDQSTPDIRIGGNGFVNTSKIPSNLVLYCKDDVVSIAISGNAQFYGAIYAPQAEINLNSGVVFGSLVGKSVKLNGANSAVHYDEALRDHANPLAKLRSWQKL